MNYFVLFSVIVIAACVFVLLLPSNHQEGFQRNDVPLTSNAGISEYQPVLQNFTKQLMAAGQRNLSRTASTADGSSGNDQLLHQTLEKHHRLAEAFENRDRSNKANDVSSTTTKKKGIASTSASVTASNDNSGPSCSTCKLNVNELTKCVLPGCFSADDGYLPFPDDGGYNFAEGCFYYNPDPSNPGKILPGMEGRPPGYYCPSITQGGSFDDGGGNGDMCYTKPASIPDTANPNSTGYTLDYAKFVKIDNACSNDKQKSQQNFVPGKDAPIDDNATYPSRRKPQPLSATASTVNHQHSGAINVYHHSSRHTQRKQGQCGNSNNSNDSSTYVAPVGGATVLGYL